MAGFNDLPPEVRNILYNNLLRGEMHTQYRHHHELALFTVSRRLHQESSSYFYQHNSIAIDAPSGTTSTATILPPVANKYLRFLRRLTIHAAIGHSSPLGMNRVATTIGALSTMGARLDELTLIISSPLSHLLSSRVDDAIIHASHPIISAIKNVLAAGVARVLRLQTVNTWLATGVAAMLLGTSGSRLDILDANGASIQDPSVMERPPTGRFASTHLATFGLDAEEVTVPNGSVRSSPLSSPSSIASSLCSAFSELDTVSVTSFELSSDDEADESLRSDSHKDDADEAEQPFFTEDDIEEWSASTQESVEEEGQALGEIDDLDNDEEMQGVRDGETHAIMQNLQEAAHHVANSDDVTYMTNFAPDLLLSRHHLGHLA